MEVFISKKLLNKEDTEAYKKGEKILKIKAIIIQAPQRKKEKKNEKSSIMVIFFFRKFTLIKSFIMPLQLEPRVTIYSTVTTKKEYIHIIYLLVELM